MTVGRLPAIPAVRRPALGAAEEPRVRVRVWDRVVRTTHWLIVFSLVVLAVTGFYIGRPFIVVPGPAGAHFVMGTMKVIHFYSAIVFSLAVLARIVWMFTGTRHARWYNFLPVTRARWRGVIETFQFYTFLRRHPPSSAGHNPLAGLSYIAVFGLYLVMIVTGLGLYAIDAHVDSPVRSLVFLVHLSGGPQLARWIHHVVMWLLIGFTVHHLYSAILTALVEKNGELDSIISGNKWLTVAEAQEEEQARLRHEQQGSRE
jgi:Ni/Fe-hydrogenase 1 B-type cytochrome subunit